MSDNRQKKSNDRPSTLNDGRSETVQRLWMINSKVTKRGDVIDYVINFRELAFVLYWCVEKQNVVQQFGHVFQDVSLFAVLKVNNRNIFVRIEANVFSCLIFF